MLATTARSPQLKALLDFVTEAQAALAPVQSAIVSTKFSLIVAELLAHAESVLPGLVPPVPASAAEAKQLREGAFSCCFTRRPAPSMRAR